MADGLDPLKGTTPRLPNLVIIGAMKCATTSLHYYLGLHPDIQMSASKEVGFFLTEENYARGIDWYASHFPDPALVHGEATPGYAYAPFFNGVAERMVRTIPKAKLVYVVRDPIDRLLSHYVHEVAAGSEGRSFRAAMSDRERNPYLLVSRYAFQLEPYLERYGPERIKILCMEDLKTKRSHTLRTVFRYLGVDETFCAARFHLQFHQTRFKRRGQEKRRRNQALQPLIQKLPFEVRGLVEKMLFRPFSKRIETPDLDEALRERLRDYFRPDIESLRRLTGDPFSSFRHEY